MKKLIITLIALALVLCSAVTVAAKDEFATAGDLYQYWSETAFPDYVCGVWSNDGTMESLTVAVQDNEAGNAGKQEILDLVADDSSVTFVYREYSYNYLRNVQDEIFLYFEKDTGLISTSVNQHKNRVDLGILTDRKDDDATREMLAELQEKYGDIFIVSYYEGICIDDAVAEEIGAVIVTTEGSNAPIAQIAVICAVVLLLLAVTVFAVRKKTLTLQTNTGENISTVATLSVHDVENMVKDSNAEVSSDLELKIMSEIENR